MKLANEAESQTTLLYDIHLHPENNVTIYRHIIPSLHPTAHPGLHIYSSTGEIHTANE